MARIAPETMTVSLTGTKPIKRMVRRLKALQDVLADHAIETAEQLDRIEGKGAETHTMALNTIRQLDPLEQRVQEALDYLRFGYKQNAESLAKLAERKPEPEPDAVLVHMATEDVTSLMAELDASLRAHVDACSYELGQRIGELRQEVHSLDSADLNARQLAYQNAADNLKLTHSLRERLTGTIGAIHDNVMSVHDKTSRIESAWVRVGKGVETLLDRQERVAATEAERLVRLEQKIDDLRARTDDAEARAEDDAAKVAALKALLEDVLGTVNSLYEGFETGKYRQYDS